MLEQNEILIAQRPCLHMSKCDNSHLTFPRTLGMAYEESLLLARLHIAGCYMCVEFKKDTVLALYV